MPTSLGTWLVAGRTGVLGTHATLLHTGQILFFTRPESTSHRVGDYLNGLPGDDQRAPQDPDTTLAALFGPADPPNSDTTLAALFGPADPPNSDVYQASAVPLIYNPFCAGHTPLADGRVLVAGGDKRGNAPGEVLLGRAPRETRYGTDRLRVFTPGAASSWQDVGTIADSRWYPTCTLLADGRVFIIAGSIDDMHEYNTQNPTYELIPPLPGGAQLLPLLAEAWPYISYPFVYLLPSGQLFVFAKDRAYYLREAPHYQPWTVADGPQLPAGDDPAGPPEEPAKQYPNSATAVLLPLLPERGYEAEVLVMGGSGANVYTHWGATAEAVDLAAGRRIDWLPLGQFCRDFNVPADEVEALAAARRWRTQLVQGELQVAIQPTLEVPAVNHCFRLKAYPQPEAAWRRAAPLHRGRVMLDAVLLPDGQVLVVNGTSRGFAGGYPATGPMSATEAVLTAELYDPEHDTWQELAAARHPRLYHSTALLLPDARVLVAGSDHQVRKQGNVDRLIKELQETRAAAGLKPPTADEQELLQEQFMAGAFEFEAEIFSPPYLSREFQPVVVDAPTQLAYGEKFALTVQVLPAFDPARLRVALLRPGSVTHGNNMSQRYVGLAVQAATATHLTVQAPPNGQVAPPGYYMLFVVYDGVPAEARFVQLCLAPAAGAGPDPVPRTDLAAWFRADLGVIANSRGEISSWSDLSGRGNHVYWHAHQKVGRSVRPPQWIAQGIHQQPTVRFVLTSNPTANGLDPQGGHLQSATTDFLSGAGAYTILTVAHPWPGGGVRNASNSPRGVGGVLGWGNYEEPGNTPAVVALCVGPGPLVQNLPQQAGRASLVTYWQRDCQPGRPELQLGSEQHTPVSQQRASLLVSAFDSEHNTWRARVNRQPVYGPLEAPTKATGRGPLTIGRTGAFAPIQSELEQESGEFFQGDLAEVLIYKRALSEAELTALEDYLSARYNLG